MPRKPKFITELEEYFRSHEFDSLSLEGARATIYAAGTSVSGKIIDFSPDKIAVRDDETKSVHIINPRAVRMITIEYRYAKKMVKRWKEALERVAEKDARLADIVRQYKEAVEKAASDPSGEPQ
jgi:hypothetical protein